MENRTSRSAIVDSGSSQLVRKGSPFFRVVDEKLSLPPRRVPYRRFRDGNVYGHTTTAMHDMSTPSPPFFFPLLPPVLSSPLHPFSNPLRFSAGFPRYGGVCSGEAFSTPSRATAVSWQPRRPSALSSCRRLLMRCDVGGGGSDSGVAQLFTRRTDHLQVIRSHSRWS